MAYIYQDVKTYMYLRCNVGGPNQPNESKVDVYLAPLMRELQTLFHGYLIKAGKDSFILKGILMMVMHDYPGRTLTPLKRWENC